MNNNCKPSFHYSMNATKHACAAAQAKAERKAAADKMKEEKAQANVPSEKCCGVDRLQNFEYLEVSLSASLVY